MASENYFSLFGLPTQFALDTAALDNTWRTLAAQVHPDRYVTATSVEKRLAMQWSSTINEAYRVLRSPLARARYLCEQAGQDIGAETNTSMNGAFLILQMDWREQLDDARAADSMDLLAGLEGEIELARAEMQASIAELIDQQNDLAGASAKVREWMFIEKMAQEAQSARHVLMDKQT